MTDSAKPKHKRKFARTPKSEAPNQSGASEAPLNADQPTKQPSTAAAKPESKTARIISLLQRPEGATLAEMVAATGWLPHTTRAALTGLKKKGHTITRALSKGWLGQARAASRRR